MAELPLTYPATSGPGRLTEIAVFQKSDISDERWHEVFDGISNITKDFPISRQQLAGTKTEDKKMAVLLCDWTSAEEKDIFEPGPRYQGIKPAFGELIHPEDAKFTCYHMIIPGPPTTAAAEAYTISYLRVPDDKRAVFTAALDDHIKDLYSSDKAKPIFHYNSRTREDDKVVVSWQGWEDRADAEAYVASKALPNLATAIESYVADMKIWKP